MFSFILRLHEMGDGGGTCLRLESCAKEMCSDERTNKEARTFSEREDIG